MKINRIALYILSVMVFTLVSGCSGGGSDNGAKTVSGVAATGAPINGTVCLRDAASHETCVVTSNGIYSFDVTTMTPPFILRASWSENGTPKELYSMAVSSGVANISPLTQAIVTEAAGGDVAGIYASSSPATLMAMAANIPVATADLKNALAPLILQYASANTDPITSPYHANHTGLDSLLDNTSFSFVNNTMTVINSVTGSIIYQAPATSIDQGVSTILWSSTEGRLAEDPSVAVDRTGNGLVLWAQSDGTRYNIESKWLYGNRGSARVSDGTASCVAPKVAFTPDGTAHAVWYQATGVGLTTIWHSHYVPGTGWTGRTQISQHTTTSAYYPQLAVDGSGNVMAVWYEANPPAGNHFDVYSSMYLSQSGTWSTPIQLSSSSHSAYRPMVAMNTAGKAIAVWPQDIGNGSVSNDNKEVVAAIWDGTSWSAPVKLNSISGVIQSIYAQVAVAIDDNGYAIALWPQSTIHAARLVNGTWGASADITNGSIGACYAPEVAFSSPGKAIAVWQQHDGSTKYEAATNSFSSNTGWGVASIISMGTESVEYPHLAVDASGNATVVWAEGFYSTVPMMMQSQYQAGMGWITPLSIATLTSADLMYTPVTAVGSNSPGQVYSVWGLDSM